ncbi:MAG: tol-pal system protein YbgF [Hyphomicrobiales bacterium]
MTRVAAFTIAAVIGLPAAQFALAQSSSQWDSLFDRIIRLEAEVRTMQSSPAAQGAGAGASPQLNQRLFNLENQMQQLLREVRTLNDRLRQIEATPGRSGSAPVLDQNRTVHGMNQQTLDSQGLPVANENYNQYAEEKLVLDSGPPPDGSVGSLQQAQGPIQLGTIRTTVPEGGVPKYNEGVEVATLDGQSITGITNASGPQELYESSYASIRNKQYSAAETGFKAFLDRYGEHKLAGNAQYWLGQSYYARGDYQVAAREFLTGYKNFGKSKKAPASLLKLGMSLNKMGKKNQACAALAQVGKQYPKAKNERKLASKEYKRAGC